MMTFSFICYSLLLIVFAGADKLGIDPLFGLVNTGGSLLLPYILAFYAVIILIFYIFYLRKKIFK